MLMSRTHLASHSTVFEETNAVPVVNMPGRDGLFAWPVVMLVAAFFLKLQKLPAVIEP